MRAFEEGRPVVEGVLNAVRQRTHRRLAPELTSELSPELT